MFKFKITEIICITVIALLFVACDTQQLDENVSSSSNELTTTQNIEVLTTTETKGKTTTTDETEIQTLTESQITEFESQSQPTIFGNEIMVSIDSIKYAKYTGTFKVDEQEVDTEELILQQAVYDEKEATAIYYISTDFIKQYWDENLFWDGEKCQFNYNHIQIIISNDNMIVDNELFGRQTERPCDTFKHDEKLYINVDSIYDVLGIKCAYKVINVDSETGSAAHIIATRDFFIETFPDMVYEEKTNYITKTFSYTGGMAIKDILGEPIWISSTGIYYYLFEGCYYAEYAGAYYPLELTKYESKDAPQ